VQEEIILSLERSLQRHPSNADALKALALFHSDITRDENAAATVLQKLAQVHPLPSLAPTLQHFIPPFPLPSHPPQSLIVRHPDS
jgi:hypothetical protein